MHAELAADPDASSSLQSFSTDARHPAQLMTTATRDNDTRILNWSGQYDSFFCSFLDALLYGSGRVVRTTFESTTAY
jgi:hypothetical protein